MYTTNRILIAMALLLPFPCFGQWNDSFSDGNFSQQPGWFGDTAHFIISQDYQLRLNAPAVSGKSYLVTASEIACSAEWKFRIGLEFNTSSSNYARVFLISDSPRLDSALHGYYLKIGSGDDDISLYRQDGSMSKLILDGPDDMTSASLNKLAVKVTRSPQGMWTIYCDSLGNDSYLSLGSTIDTSYWHSSYFGIQCIYTSTRSKKFSFDDFSVSGKSSNDSIPPRISSCQAENDTCIKLQFSDVMDIRSMKLLSNYDPGNDQKINSVRIINNTISVNISNAIACNQPLLLKVSGLCDLSGNRLADTSILVSYCPGELYDVIIDEIMADPDPPVSLPNQEYLELYNRTGTSLDLQGWYLQINGDILHIPDIILPSKGFLVVTNSNACTMFPDNRPCLGLLPAYSLTNDGSYLGIKNKSGKLIHWVNYKKDWYRDLLKENGGWSLEMIDTGNPCVGPENWKASISPEGGSPFEKNSLSDKLISDEAFIWLHYVIPNDSTLRVYFSAPVDQETIFNNSFEADNGIGNPSSIQADTLEERYLDLQFKRHFQRNTIYTLTFSGEIFSCSGMALSDKSGFTFGMSEKVEPGDILINEILFNPAPGGNEFVEIYNKTDKFISTKDLQFSYRASGGNYDRSLEIGEYPFILPPHTFLVLTSGIKGLTDFFSLPDKRLVAEISVFPNLNNQEGCFKLNTKDLNNIDEFCYSEKLHFPLLVNFTGVSLERISYEQPAQDGSNWHSAASSEGYGTPGRSNSQHLESYEINEDVKLEEEIFSPDNDGNKDVESLRYKLSKPGYVANIIIFDASGRKIRTLANNLPIGTEGFLEWNGLDDKGKLAPTGIYLFYTELHHPSGDVKKYKNVCILGGKLSQ